MEKKLKGIAFPSTSKQPLQKLPRLFVDSSSSLVIKEWKPINDPHPRKKLLVLDLDQTIYDMEAPTKELTMRPHLYKFLKSVYKHYNIGIWSATNMTAIETKVTYIGLDNHSDFKLSFLMDKMAMKEIVIEHETEKIKSLEAVWDKYPEFNKRNTLICDDLELNLYSNPRNGIKIDPYFYVNHNYDTELLKLMRYLERISGSKDFSLMSHAGWSAHPGY